MVYIALTTDFTILEQGPKPVKTAFTYTQLPTTVGTEEVFTSSRLHLWITKQVLKELPHIAS